MSDAPLHPRRIQVALAWLADDDYAACIDGDILETCIAALKLLQKGQKVTGLTTDVADIGASGLALIRVLTRIR